MSEIEVNKYDNTAVTADLVRELLKDRKRDRRWRNLRFFAGFFLFLFFVGMLFSKGPAGPSVAGGGHGGYVSLIRLNGMISPGSEFSAEEVVPILRKALADKKSKGLVIDINSGGGTPVQAAIIHDEILKLKKRYHKKVVVVGEDIMASGAYYVAVSADKIYVNPNTITGSIGVIMEGFGFPDLIKKIGIDRRVIASGTNKDRLDPFLPETPEDIAKMKTVLEEVHNNFDQVVLNGRQGKLAGNQQELFSGDFWSGQTAMKLGLVDALGNLSDAMQTEFNVTRYRDYSESNNVLRSLVGHLNSVLHLDLGEDLHLVSKL